MATEDEERRLRLQQYQPQQPTADLGVNPLPQAPNTPQQDLATQMATLIAGMQSSPGGGTVTVNQPAPTTNPALSAVQAMQGGATPAQAIQPTPTKFIPPGTPESNQLINNVLSSTSNLRNEAQQNDLGATIAKALAPDQGGGLAKAVEAMRSPADVAERRNVEQNIANQRAMGRQATADVASNARIASQRVAEELPGQTPGMFPEGLSKLLVGNQGTFSALPSGGYAIGRTRAEQDAIEAGRRRRFATINPNYKPPKTRRPTGEEILRTYG